MKVKNVSEIKIGDRVRMTNLGVTGHISHIDPDRKYRYEVTEDDTGKRYMTIGTNLEPIASDKPFNCCGCVHFELCRGMFGNAGKLPCDFDDYFEARESAETKFAINISISPDVDVEKLCEKIKAEIMSGLS